MAELDTKKREGLRSSQFAYVDRKGGEHLPINDESHIRNAMARWNQTEFESAADKERARKKIVSAAGRREADALAPRGKHQARAPRRTREGLARARPGRRAGRRAHRIISLTET
jgi:hypothetical protein